MLFRKVHLTSCAPLVVSAIAFATAAPAQAQVAVPTDLLQAVNANASVAKKDTQARKRTTGQISPAYDEASARAAMAAFEAANPVQPSPGASTTDSSADNYRTIVPAPAVSVNLETAGADANTTNKTSAPAPIVSGNTGTAGSGADTTNKTSAPAPIASGNIGTAGSGANTATESDRTTAPAPAVSGALPDVPAQANIEPITLQSGASSWSTGQASQSGDNKSTFEDPILESAKIAAQIDAEENAPSGSKSPALMAQAVPTDTLRTTPMPVPSDTNVDTSSTPVGAEQDTELTPVSIPRPNKEFNNLRLPLLYTVLPKRMFLTVVADNSLRYEMNVFQTYRHYKGDLVYRTLPNVTLGYAITPRFRVYSNYFFLRDQYDRYSRYDKVASLNQNFNNIQFGAYYDALQRGRNLVQLGFAGRALFSTPDRFHNQSFYDLLPQLNYYRTTDRGILYATVLGQIRFRQMIYDFQEGDQFYSFGYIWRPGRWQFLFDNTLDNNFGNSAPRFRDGHNNQMIILTQEVARQVIKQLPMQLYCRTQEIFNMGANSSPGYAGVNFRVFGGIRMYYAKNAIYPPKLDKLATK